MKSKLRIPLLFLLALVVILGTSAFNLTNLPEDRVIFGGTFEVSRGTTLTGNLIILGGTVTIEEGANVSGDVVLVGGKLDTDGTIFGTLVSIGGNSSLGDHAIVRTDLVTVGGSLTRAPGSTILGQVTNIAQIPLSLSIPWLINRQPLMLAPTINPSDLTGSIIYLIGAVLFTSALSMLVALLWPRPTQRVANAIRSNLIGTGGFGCLTLIVAPGLLLLIALTIILFPLSVIGMLALLVAVVFGWIALNLEVGNRLARLFKVEWSAPIAAGIGGVFFNLVVFTLGMIPCLGWTLVLLVMLFAMGGVLVTRFGTSDYPQPAPARPVPPVLPLPPARPAPTARQVESRVTDTAKPETAVKARPPRKPAAKSGTVKTEKPAPRPTGTKAAAKPAGKTRSTSAKTDKGSKTK